ncbi:MAG: hypothetical protein ACRDRH_26120 [Pseudonocardia sp.]
MIVQDIGDRAILETVGSRRNHSDQMRPGHRATSGEMVMLHTGTTRRDDLYPLRPAGVDRLRRTVS